MVKIKKSTLLIVLSLWSMATASDIFERKCVPCHRELPTSLQEMFKEYLLVYSSEKFVKIGIKHYLKNPSASITLMSDLFINTYGIKKKTDLSKEELNEAIDIYWDNFKVFGKLK